MRDVLVVKLSVEVFSGSNGSRVDSDAILGWSTFKVEELGDVIVSRVEGFKEVEETTTSGVLLLDGSLVVLCKDVDVSGDLPDSCEDCGGSKTSEVVVVGISAFVVDGPLTDASVDLVVVVGRIVVRLADENNGSKIHGSPELLVSVGLGRANTVESKPSSFESLCPPFMLKLDA